MVSQLRRTWKTIASVIVVLGTCSAIKGQPAHGDEQPAAPDGLVLQEEPFAYDVESAFPADEISAPPLEFDEPACQPHSYWPCMSWLGLRHSYTDGRSVGFGGPLVGTSWLNRPIYVGFDLGPLWMTRAVEDSVSRDVDIIGGVFLGHDWDHYWGNELAFHWATPELVNRHAPGANRTDSLFIWSYNVMYYPWGDSAIRPYWRWGIGNTHVDFPRDNGSRHDEWLLTFPIGVGVKVPFRRWLVCRAELTDQLAVGDSDVHTLHNLTLTWGLEWRFGAHPRSYWPWHPSRHIW
jgi:hypothetical protein